MRGLLILVFCVFSFSYLSSQSELEKGFHLLENGQYEAALSFFSDDTLPKEYNKTVKICYARALGLSGAVPQALDVLQQLSLQYPEDTEIALNVAEAFLWNNSYEEALALYASLVVDNPQSFVANYGYANANAALDEDLQALHYMEVALSLDPDNEQAHIAFNSILLKSAFNSYKAGRYVNAIATLDKINEQYVEVPKIEALRSQITRATQSNFGLQYSQDQDSNNNSSSRIGLNVDFGFAERHRISMQSTYRELTDPIGTSAIQQSIAFSDRIKLSKRFELTTGLAATGVGYNEVRDTRITSQFKISSFLSQKLFTEMAYTRDMNDATQALLELELYTHNVSLVANYMLTPRLGLFSRTEWQEQSDANRLLGQVFSLYYTLNAAPLIRIGSNGSFQAYKFNDPSYFTPEYYRHMELFFLIENLKSTGWQYRAQANVGHQSIAETPQQITYKLEGSLGYTFRSGIAINSQFLYNSAAQLNTGGAYDYFRAGLNLSYSL